MPIGMHGANTPELREIAGQFAYRGDVVLQSAQTLRAQIGRVDWEGPDRDRFLDEWARTDRALINLGDLVDRLGTATLPRQADGQDDASAGHGGAPLTLGEWQRRTGGLVFSSMSEGEQRAHDTRVDDEDRHLESLAEIPNDEGDIDPYEINQQALGDCWVLASVASVAGTDPNLLAENVRYDAENNDYLVTLYDDGEPVEVRVDGSFAYNEESGSYEYAVGDDGRPNYASIYEKAFAEFHGDTYGDIWGGYADESLATITGRETETQSFDTFWPWEQAASSESIAKRLDDGQSVVLSTRADLGDSSPIVGSHAYTVVEVRGDDSVVLYNPWGSNPSSDFTSVEGLEPGEIVVPADDLGEFFSRVNATT
ncbi:MAG: C2 family cysteine protease [Pseudoclavibacter sp.]